MTTPEFIEWLDRKMAEPEHGVVGKLVPPDDELSAELETQLKARVRAIVTERILREAGAEDQIKAALDAIARPVATALKAGVEALFGNEPEAEWRAYVETVVAKICRKVKRARDNPRPKGIMRRG
jgi:hypothetical protein